MRLVPGVDATKTVFVDTPRAIKQTYQDSVKEARIGAAAEGRTATGADVALQMASHATGVQNLVEGSVGVDVSENALMTDPLDRAGRVSTGSGQILLSFAGAKAAAEKPAAPTVRTEGLGPYGEVRAHHTHAKSAFWGMPPATILREPFR